IARGSKLTAILEQRFVVEVEDNSLAEGTAAVQAGYGTEGAVFKDIEVQILGSPQETAAEPDRRAAEYVLSLGGAVGVNGAEREIRAAADLPQEPFRLTHVRLDGNKQVTDAGLAHFKDCKDLRVLGLDRTPVTDAGLASFKDCK